MAERYQLRLVTTGRELLDLNEPLRSQGKTPLVVANPDFDLVLGESRRSFGPAISSRAAQQEEEEVAIVFFPIIINNSFYFYFSYYHHTIYWIIQHHGVERLRYDKTLLIIR